MTGLEALKPNLKISFPVYHVMTSNQKACDLSWEKHGALSPNVDIIRNPTKDGKSALYFMIISLAFTNLELHVHIVCGKIFCCPFWTVAYYLKSSHLLNCTTLISFIILYYPILNFLSKNNDNLSFALLCVIQCRQI